jgi:hypothetical protein
MKLLNYYINKFIFISLFLFIQLNIFLLFLYFFYSKILTKHNLTDMLNTLLKKYFLYIKIDLMILLLL